MEKHLLLAISYSYSGDPSAEHASRLDSIVVLVEALGMRMNESDVDILLLFQSNPACRGHF